MFNLTLTEIVLLVSIGLAILLVVAAAVRVLTSRPNARHGSPSAVSGTKTGSPG